MRKTFYLFLQSLIFMTICIMVYISKTNKLFKYKHYFLKRNLRHNIEYGAVHQNVSVSTFYSKKNNLASLERAIEEAVVISRRIIKRKPPVLITLLNDAYLPFAYSWLCNTKTMNIHSQVLFFVTNTESFVKLKREWPEVNLVCLPEEFDIRGRQLFSRVGYTKLMIARTYIIYKLLLKDIRLLLFEVDCLWISNPIPECLNNLKDNDILGTRRSKKGYLPAGGFLFFSTTNTMKKFWGLLNEQTQDLLTNISKKHNYEVERENEQDYLTKLFRKKVVDIKFAFLPWERYPDGLWYRMSKQERDATDPLLINNNWISGNEKKIARAEKWGHWFIDDDWVCDEKLRDKIVKL